ncbi:hypothetical protein [Lacrimispora defluvii]|uniref:Uncharacterized protein n=1 Tax=Lacrimispora defluvii TaxID=2719233 RepID=A0ABX1VUC8_9FIRM|nr:hypothetical protein [Lacrimispora defluvii]NNJ32050.1 hypothetical protein [Lacrimispora defluvii]
MKRRKMSHRLLLFLICIATVSTGMYIPNRGADSFFSCANTMHTLPSASENDKRIDAIEEKPGIVVNEIKAEILFGISNTSSSRNGLKILSLPAVKPFLLLVTWIIINVFLRNEFVDRLYLILYIHDSDGKKGDRQAF